ncbi:hypothetical protein FACS1894140_1330 [Spirochaetia bacterium]|nr:hypothetical protein FACS1894140_1330 [Spirochaetia bacterium]
MIHLLFSLRFRSQLRRTRPELISGLEKFIVRAIEAAGGSPRNRRRILTASFDENVLGIWLDILVLIENIIKAMDEDAADLYGYTIIIGRDIPEEEWEPLCRQYSGGDNGLPYAGKIPVWCDPVVRQAIGYYVFFDKPQVRQGSQGYIRLKGIKIFAELHTNVYPLRDIILKALAQGEKRNILLLGPEYSGKRDGLYRYCREMLGEHTPLIIRFDVGGRFLSPFADAYSPRIREFIVNSGAPAEILQELDRLGEFLFRDRLRSEISISMIRTGYRFFLLLLETYTAASAGMRAVPVMILENVYRVEDAVARLFMDAWTAFADRGKLLIYGTAKTGERVKAWDQVFSRVVRLEVENQPPLMTEKSRDLWEIAYAFHLLGRFFPGTLLSTLLEEEGKNPAMITRALDMFCVLGVVDFPEDPRPRIRYCPARAERILGERKELVHALVRNRLLDWVNRGRLYPCFALLEVLEELGNSGAASARDIARQDELVLKGITLDLVNCTYARIEEVINAGRLEKIIGKERFSTILYLFKTYKALIHEGEEEIRKVFVDLPATEQLYPVYKAQVLANITAYHLGIRDVAAAQETIKEAIHLSQDRSWSGLAQSYRLFALLNIIKQQMGETIEYVTFAVENAEKSGNIEELGVSSYYAAAAQFLFGNLSRAEKLAAQAETQSLAAGRYEWTDRARFFRGKLAFDLGRYQDACSVFEDILKNPAGLNSPEKDALLAAWAYRAQIYTRNSFIPKPEGGGIDADLFEIEASYLLGDFARTVELSDRLAVAVPQDYFLYTEQPDWRSGFAQCELLLLPQREFWDRMISTYHSLALCRLSAAGGQVAVRNMQRILRDERISEMDPNDAFYFYAWYRVYEESGAAQVDMNTAVSMAFKRLQRRASRIDDVETRRVFLSGPRWNNAMSLAAREHKLI